MERDLIVEPNSPALTDTTNDIESPTESSEPPPARFFAADEEAITDTSNLATADIQQPKTPQGFSSEQKMAPFGAQSGAVAEVAVKNSETKTAALLNNDTPECRQAKDEFNQANASSEGPDKLFHLRRALRLCPNTPEYHRALSEVYRSMGRIADADFELAEANRAAQ
jgi:Flp pilus assembly protein TadD